MAEAALRQNKKYRTLKNGTLRIGLSNSYKKWTKNEINFVRVNYKKMKACEIAKILKRSTFSVYARIKAERANEVSPYKFKKQESYDREAKKALKQQLQNQKDVKISADKVEVKSEITQKELKPVQEKTSEVIRKAEPLKQEEQITRTVKTDFLITLSIIAILMSVISIFTNLLIH